MPETGRTAASPIVSLPFCIFPWNMLMGGVPRNFATKRFTGSSYTSWGFPICWTTPLLHDNDLVGNTHGFLLIVGDENSGDLRCSLDLADFPPVSAASAGHPGWREARPAGVHAAFLPGHGRWRRAAAVRLTVHWVFCPSNPRSEPDRRPGKPRSSISDLESFCSPLKFSKGKRIFCFTLRWG